MDRPAPQPRRRPRKQVPAPVQLGVRPRTMLVRGLFIRCPACGGGHVFRNWFSMVERCPTCTLKFERVEGHWIGSLGLNTTVVFAAMLAVLLGGSIITYPEVPLGPLLGAELTIAILGPLVFFPPSRTLWTATDLLMRPLNPGEIDPRFVLVDPERDAPRAN